MAQGLILEFDGVDADTYEAVNARLGTNPHTGEGDWPAGDSERSSAPAWAGALVLSAGRSAESWGRVLRCSSGRVAPSFERFAAGNVDRCFAVGDSFVCVGFACVFQALQSRESPRTCWPLLRFVLIPGHGLFFWFLIFIATAPPLLSICWACETAGATVAVAKLPAAMRVMMVVR